MGGFDTSEFRKALGCFPTGVTIVTARNPLDGRRVGITVSSFNSVSLDPPLVLWSLAKRSPNLQPFERGAKHAIHVLSHAQADLARRFADSSADKFEGVVLETDEKESPPILADVAARFDCITQTQYDGGDHVIVLARVTAFVAMDKSPLIYSAGRLFSLGEVAGR